jgi:hypothetical protein
MRYIKKYVDHIEDEIEGAREYAEEFVENKIKGDMRRANIYKDMASTELTHAMNIHEFAVQDIEELKKVYTPPVEMLEKWEHAHKVALEQVANIKQILSL